MQSKQFILYHVHEYDLWFKKKKKKKDMETAVCMDCFITFIVSIIETVVIYLTSTEIKWNK